MSVVGSKLLMCVCAGATGAAVVPVVQKARAAFTHRAAAHGRPAPGAISPLPVNCAPTIASAMPIALPPIASAQPAAVAASTPLPAAFESFAVAGFAAAGGGGPFLPGPGVGGGGINTPGTPLYTSPTVLVPGGFGDAVPEPGTWTMMISGFGLIGAGVRWQRRHEA